MGMSAKTVQYLAATCASIGFIFAGACISWPSPAIPKFKNGDANIKISDAETSWMVSLATLGVLPGCYFGQMLNDRVGRKKTMISAAIPALIGSTIMLLTKTPVVMCIARIMMGISSGITILVTMIYITEIADKQIRGSLGMLVEVMNNLGELIIYGIGPFVSYALLNSIMCLIPVCYVLFCLWIPESPYYHLKDGRVDAAKKEFMKIKNTQNGKWEDDFEVIRMHIREEMKKKTTAIELLTNLRYRKNLYIVAGLNVLQYMTGALALFSYLEMIFRQSSSMSGPQASIIIGVVQLAAGILAAVLAGWFSRRFLLFVSCLGVAVSLTIVGVYFFLQDFIQVTPETLMSISSLPLIGMLGFNVLYSIGIGNLPYVMQAELFPINVKGAASSMASMFASILNFLVTQTYQVIKDNFGHYTVFWIFGVIAYAGIYFIYFCVPETMDKTLEEINDERREKDPEREPLCDELENDSSD